MEGRPGGDESTLGTQWQRVNRASPSVTLTCRDICRTFAPRFLEPRETPPMSASNRVFVACDDMFFRVNLEARIRSAGLEPVGVDSLEAVNTALASGAPRAAFVDLHLRKEAAIPIIDRLSASRPGMPIISFGSYCEGDILYRARRAGAVALPRSRFDRDFASILGKIAVGTLSPSLQTPPPKKETNE